jgi:hypothetical protein
MDRDRSIPSHISGVYMHVNMYSYVQLASNTISRGQGSLLGIKYTKTTDSMPYV